MAEPLAVRVRLLADAKELAIVAVGTHELRNFCCELLCPLWRITSTGRKSLNHDAFIAKDSGPAIRFCRRFCMHGVSIYLYAHNQPFVDKDEVRLNP